MRPTNFFKFCSLRDKLLINSVMGFDYFFSHSNLFFMPTISDPIYDVLSVVFPS